MLRKVMNIVNIGVNIKMSSKLLYNKWPNKFHQYSKANTLSLYHYSLV